MKSPRTLAVLLALASAGAAVQLTAKPFVVHEWGTFTSVSGSDGKLLPGLEVEEQALPPFVHSHAGFFPLNKGWNRPLANVTVKMETPVLYFYSDVARSVQVDVKFQGGSISQWYPERIGGEVMKGPVGIVGAPPAERQAAETTSAVDFAKGYFGSASWWVEVLAPGASDRISSNQSWETPEFVRSNPSFAHWARARVDDANKVRGPGPSREVDGFIFYRGVGNFALPLRVTCDAQDRVKIENTGGAKIPFVFVYDQRESGSSSKARVWWSGPLAGGESRRVPEEPSEISSRGESATRVLQEIFPQALQEAGLTKDEAKALLATWEESYFQRAGLRVFWIVPREFTDSILPIAIKPMPDKLERVLVGRTEVLSPQFENQLKHDFAADRGQRWITDRYYQAYLARVRQLGVVLADARP